MLQGIINGNSLKDSTHKTIIRIREGEHQTTILDIKETKEGTIQIISNKFSNWNSPN